MKQLCATLLVIAVLGSLLAFSAGCVLNNSDLVITDNICVNLQETQTSGSISTFVVADKFADQLSKKLKDYGKSTGCEKHPHGGSRLQGDDGEAA